MPFAETWMDLEIVILSEVSQTQKDKYPMKMNLFTRQKETHRLRK